MNNICEQQNIQQNGASLVGFGDVSILGTELTNKFPVATSIAIKYDDKIIDNLHLDEESFHNHLVALK